MRDSCARWALLLSFVFATAASAVTMDWTPIANPGNTADPDTGMNTHSCGLFFGEPCGAVPYNYAIGTYEVTNAQYAEFLNAKASSDPYELYNPQMADPNPGPPPYYFYDGFGGIARSGSSGSYTYSAIPGRENLPVNWVSLYDALRFANWMNNGQGGADTESGVYTLLGGTPQPSNGVIVTRNPGVSIVLASENEWYKAAYYDPSSASYFDFPTGSNALPICSTPSAGPNRANCNYVSEDPVDVGSYPGSASPYGTFDQGGNVWEWTESISALSGGDGRTLRGGGFDRSSTIFAKDVAGSTSPYFEHSTLGFRLAMIPEPTTGLLVIAGLVGFAGRRRARA